MLESRAGKGFLEGMGIMATATSNLTSGRISRIRRRALEWYAREKRDLPWRNRPTPYRVWVSEILLQQTRVETAIPYFRDLMRRFPSLRSLSRARVDEVLMAWSGLGYYRRARNLHQAVREVEERYGGRVPRSEEGLRSLPGIGDYTAGAIRSIAFGERAAAVDGNTFRVVARLQAYRGDPKRSGAMGRVRRWAEALVPTRDPGLFNQALMDLGARICLPRNPSCEKCPIRGSCRARKQGLARSIPPASPSRSRRVREVAAVIRRGGRVLLARRPDKGLLGGLWELPGGEMVDSLPEDQFLRDLTRERLGLQVRVVKRLGEIRHSIMDRQIRGVAFDCRVEKGRLRTRVYEACRWLSPEEIRGVPITGATRKYLPHLAKAARTRAV